MRRLTACTILLSVLAGKLALAGEVLPDFENERAVSVARFAKSYAALGLPDNGICPHRAYVRLA